jgi:hypothetical protein
MGLNHVCAVEGRSPRKPLILQWWHLVHSRGSDRGIAMPLASRTSQGLRWWFAQGVNREARDVAGPVITQFGAAINREDDQFMPMAANDQA